MVVVSSILLGFYFCSLLCFSLVTHPVGYCILLVQGAVSLSAYAYLVMGFSWYLVLFCLVYIGGVYILFIFVSIYSSNSPPSSTGSAEAGVMPSLVFFCVLFFYGSFVCSCGVMDNSHYLCSFFEGFSYCLFCLVLILGFSVVSLINGAKDSFFR